MRQKIALQIQYADAQHKDIADPDEHTRNYSDDDYDSYAQGISFTCLFFLFATTS